MVQIYHRVDKYIEKSASFAQPILTYLRQMVHQACPDVEEQKQKQRIQETNGSRPPLIGLRKGKTETGNIKGKPLSRSELIGIREKRFAGVLLD